MSIGDIVTKVLTRYEADVSGEKRALDDLIRKNDDLKKKEQEAADAREKHFDSLILDLTRASRAEQEAIDHQTQMKAGVEKTAGAFDGLLAKATLAFTGINQGLQVFGKVISFAQQAIKDWNQDLIMDATNAGRSIDDLSNAFQGLVDDDAINQFAAKVGNGALKLTQQQMEEVAQAAVVLRERGFDLTQTIDALTDAAVSGRTRGLHQLGIDVDDTGTKANTAKNLMAELNKVIAESHGPANKAADDVQRMAVAYRNAGDAASNFAAATMSAIGASVSLDTIQKEIENRLSEPGRRAARPDIFQAFARGYGGFGGVAGGRAQQQALATPDTIEMPEENLARSPAQVKAIADAAATAAALVLLHSGRTEAFVGGGGPAVNDLQGGIAHNARMATAGVSTEAIQKQIEVQNLTDDWFRRLSGYQQQESLLKKLGVPSVDEWDMARAGIQAFSNALGPALDQIAQGHMSAGKAAKMMAGQTIHALGDTLAQKAAAEAVEGAAMLVTLNPAGGLHLAAAGILGAGAVAAYAAASRLGGGGGSASSTPSTSGSASAGASNPSFGSGKPASGTGERTIVVIGDSFSRSSPRMAQLEAERVVDLAYGGSGVTHR